MREITMRKSATRIECFSNSLEPFRALVLDEKQRCIWEITQELPSGGFLRFTKFRVLTELLLKMKGQKGCYWIHRKAGFLFPNFTIEQPEGSLIWNIESRIRKYEIKDRWQQKIGECFFNNPLILGRDYGVVKLNNDIIVAEVVLSSSLFSERWKAEFISYSIEWEALIVALTAM